MDGEEVEVDFNELKSGYKRKQFYQQGVERLGEEHRAVAPHLKFVASLEHDPAFKQHVLNYYSGNPYGGADLDPDLRVSEAELRAMLDEKNPAHDASRATRVLEKRERWMQQNQTRAAQLAQAQAAQRQWMERVRPAITEQARKAVEEVHGKGSYDELAGDVANYLRSIGLTDAAMVGELSLNPIFHRMAYDAAQANKSISASLEVKQRLASKRKFPKPPRTARAGTGSRGGPTTSAQKSRQLFAKAQQTQKDDDWAAAIASRLDKGGRLPGLGV